MTHGHVVSDRCEWLTPKYIIDDLGPFDLDPCSSVYQKFPTATRQLTKEDDGLITPWHGLVWMNPPYGRNISAWIERLHQHGSGIALIFARTETEAWWDHVWSAASSILFIKGRIHFLKPDGTEAKDNSGAPSALVAYGDVAAERLRRRKVIEGKLVPLLT